jgi:SAM-dependent methyltransferase
MNARSSADRRTCPVCAAPDAADLVEIRGVPVLCNRLWPDRAGALAAPRGDLALGLCTSCGHVFNRAFDPALVKYSPSYDNSLHFSPRFQEYAEALARRLIDRHGLHGKNIIEIGCGKGDFLLMLCELGGNRGTGFDTSYVERDAPGTATGRVAFVRDYYSEKYADRKADMICFRHVLEHVPDPAGFLRGIRRAAGERTGTLIYAEVPDGAFTFERMGIWDLIYEHFSYFSSGSLARLFRKCGFDVIDLVESFEGQFLGIEASLGVKAEADRTAEPPGGSNLGAESIPDPAVFASAFQSKFDAHRRLHEELRRDRRRAVVWGAGSKGITYLNILTESGIISAGAIEYIVDLNPGKQGRHVPGTGQRVVAPDFLREHEPDVVIVMNPNYREEIESMVHGLGLAPRIITV